MEIINKDEQLKNVGEKSFIFLKEGNLSVSRADDFLTENIYGN